MNETKKYKDNKYVTAEEFAEFIKLVTDSINGLSASVENNVESIKILSTIINVLNKK